MSLKGSHTTADYMEWNTMLNLIRKLYRDVDVLMSLLIGCGCFFGLRVSDLRKLTWSMLLDEDRFTLIEQKTGKRRVMKVISEFQSHILQCKETLKGHNLKSPCFLSRLGTVITTQRINRRLKEIKTKYNLNVEDFWKEGL